MKKFLIILIILAGAIYVPVRFYKQNVYLSEQKTSLQNNIYALTDSVKYLKIQNNIIVAQKTSLALSLKDFKAKYNAEYELVKKLKGRPENISTVTSFIHDTIKSIAYIDTLKNIHADFKDDYLLAKIDIDRTLNAKLDYQLKDSLILTQIVTQRRFLGIRYGRKTEKLNVVSLNPKMKISNIKFIKILK